MSHPVQHVSATGRRTTSGDEETTHEDDNVSLEVTRQDPLFPRVDELGHLSALTYKQVFGSEVIPNLRPQKSFLHYVNPMTWIFSLVNFLYKKEADEFIPIPLDENWVVLATSHKIWDGYYGSAYYNQKLKQIVIAHRGTQLSNFGSVWADVQGIYRRRFTSQMKSAFLFTQFIVQEYENDARSISVTGHSLGGWLAQVSSFLMKYPDIVNKIGFGESAVRDHYITHYIQVNDQIQSNRRSRSDESYHLHTVTFDSPGSEQMLTLLLDILPRYHDDRLERPRQLNDLDVSIYFSTPNAINSCNRHIGSIYLITDKEGLATNGELKISPISWLRFLRYTLDSHGILNMVRLLQDYRQEVNLNALAENEIHIYQVKDWPLGHSEQNEYHVQTPTQIQKRYSVEKYNPMVFRTSVFNDIEITLLEKVVRVRDWLERERKLWSFLDFELQNELWLSELSGSFEISEELSQIITLSPDSSFDLDSFVRQVRLLVLNQNLVDKLNLIDLPSTVELNQNNIQSIYVSTLPKLSETLIIEDSFHLISFLESETHSILQLRTEKSTFILMTKLFKFFNTSLSIPLHYKLKYNHLFIDSGRLSNSEVNLGILELANKNLNLLVVELLDELSDVLIRTIASQLNARGKKLILLTSNSPSAILMPNEINSIHNNLAEISFHELTTEQQESVLKMNVMFQGESIRLCDLGFSPDILSKMDSSTLVKFLKQGQIKFGSSIPKWDEFDSTYYITRELRKSVFNSEELWDLLVQMNMRFPSLFLTKNSQVFADEILKQINPMHLSQPRGRTSPRLRDVSLNRILSLYPYIFEKAMIFNHTLIFVLKSDISPESFDKLKYYVSESMVGFWFKYDNDKIDSDKFEWLSTFGDIKFNGVNSEDDCYIPKDLKKSAFTGVELRELLYQMNMKPRALFLAKNSQVSVDWMLEQVKAKDIDQLGNHPQELRVSINYIIRQFSNIFEKVVVLNYTVICVLKSEISPESVDMLKSFVTSRMAGFWFKYDNDMFEWVLSFGGFKFNGVYSEDDILNDKLVLISDESGIGKTTLLKQIVHKKKAMKKSMWIVFLDLLTEKDKFLKIMDRNDFTLEQIVDFFIDFEKEDFSQEFTRSLFDQALLNGNVTFIFDSFDEISSELQGRILSISQILREKTNGRVWIATRIHDKHELVNAFQTEPYTLCPMEQSKSEILLGRIWTNSSEFKKEPKLCNSDEIVRRYARESFKKLPISLRSTEQARLYGIPLHIKMLGLISTDHFIEYYKNACKSEGNVHAENQVIFRDIVDVYERFVAKKYDIYFRDRRQYPEEVMVRNPDDFETLSREINRVHESLSFRLLYPNESEGIVGITSQKDKETAIRVNIINSIKYDNVNFLHRSFAEYFVANTIFNCLNPKECTRYDRILTFLRDNYFSGHFENIRIFLDILLARQVDVHDCIFEKIIQFKSNKDLNIYRELDEGYDQIKSCVDLLGRSVLHYLSRCGVDVEVSLWSFLQYKEIYLKKDEFGKTFVEYCPRFQSELNRLRENRYEYEVYFYMRNAIPTHDIQDVERFLRKFILTSSQVLSLVGNVDSGRQHFETCTYLLDRQYFNVLIFSEAILHLITHISEESHKLAAHIFEESFRRDKFKNIAFKVVNSLTVDNFEGYRQMIKYMTDFNEIEYFKSCGNDQKRLLYEIVRNNNFRLLDTYDGLLECFFEIYENDNREITNILFRDKGETDVLFSKALRFELTNRGLERSTAASLVKLFKMIPSNEELLRIVNRHFVPLVKLIELWRGMGSDRGIKGMISNVLYDILGSLVIIDPDMQAKIATEMKKPPNVLDDW